MKKILAIVLVAALLLSFAACSSKKTDDTTKAAEATEQKAAETVADVEAIKAAGKIVVGITDYAPMDFKDKNGEWTGFDAEFATIVAEKLGVKVEFVEIDWDNKFLELKTKSIDCIWNGMTITDEVKNNSNCTKPYAKNEQVVVIAKDKAANIKSVEDLKDLTFAVEKGSAGETAATDNKLKTTAVQNQTNCLLEVKAGSVDACIIDSTMADTMTGEGTSYADLTKSLSLTKEEYGIGCRIGSDLTDQLNTYIDELKADGTLAKLAEKYEIALAD